MKLKYTKFPGLVQILPEIYSDTRGSFHEVYNLRSCYNNKLPTHFFQDNESFSREGVLRGLHFQKPPHAQGKLIRVIWGRVLDVVVDLRCGSPTYLQTYSLILDNNQKNMLYIPEGFAHGFYALSDAIFSYKCTSEYCSEAESGIRYDDGTLNIDWYGDSPKIVSSKDSGLPFLEEALKVIEACQDPSQQFHYSV